MEKVIRYFCFFILCFWAIPSGAKRLFLALNSGITTGRYQGSIQDGVWTWVDLSAKQAPALLYYCSGPLGFFCCCCFLLTTVKNCLFLTAVLIFHLCQKLKLNYIRKKGISFLQRKLCFPLRNEYLLAIRFKKKNTKQQQMSKNKVYVR